MAIIVERTDTFEEWRLKTNLISLTADATSNIGNLQQLVTVTKSNIVAAINETETSANITGGRATFTGNVVINYNGSNSALRITQTGTGNALLVEDAANPDSTPFIVDNTGNVGIGGVPSASKFLISDSEKGMTIYGAGGATVPYAIYASGGVNAVLGQVVGANSAIRGYNSTTNSNGYLGHQYYGVHGVGPTDGVGAGEAYGVVGTVTGLGNVAVHGYNGTTLALAYLSLSGYGVQGYGGSQNVGAGESIGVYGEASGTGNIGVIGKNETTNSFGYLGRQYYGVHGVGPLQGVGPGESIGVVGTVTGSANIGVYGYNETTVSYGYLGLSGSGVQGYGGTQNVGYGASVGVYGQASGTANVGVFGSNESGFGGYFVGNAYISGDVGVGTTNPAAKLDVRGGNVLFSSSGEGAIVRIDNTETTNAFLTTCLSLRFTDMANVTANVNSAFLACTDSANIGGSIARLAIRPSGSIQNLTGTYGTFSDRRVKENIVDATSKLDDVMQLRVRNFNFTNDTLKQIGFVAQEMEEVFPGLVEIGENDMKAVKTSILIPILVKALQELTIQVDDLKYELNLLKANIS